MKKLIALCVAFVVALSILSTGNFVESAKASHGRQQVIVQKQVVQQVRVRQVRQPIIQRHRQRVVVQQQIYAQPVVQQVRVVQPVYQPVYQQQIIAQPVVQQYCAPDAGLQFKQAVQQPACSAFFAP